MEKLNLPHINLQVTIKTPSVDKPLSNDEKVKLFGMEKLFKHVKLKIK